MRCDSWAAGRDDARDPDRPRRWLARGCAHADSKKRRRARARTDTRDMEAREWKVEAAPADDGGNPRARGLTVATAAERTGAGSTAELTPGRGSSYLLELLAQLSKCTPQLTLDGAQWQGDAIRNLPVCHVAQKCKCDEV